MPLLSLPDFLHAVGRGLPAMALGLMPLVVQAQPAVPPGQGDSSRAAAAVGTGAPPPAPRPPASPQGPQAGALSPGLMACLILPARSADLGSPLPGVVEAVAVDRGDLVRQGQVLVRLRADVEAAQIDAARLRAESESELRGAIAAEDLALQRLQRARRLLSESFISTQALEQADSEWRVARERVAQARDARDVAARETQVSRAQAAQRVIRAPFDGVITERFAHPGERFEERPLLRLAVVQALRVEVVVPAALFGQIRVGQQAVVQPELPSIAARSAPVTQVDRVLDPASNTFRVRIELPNADLGVPAGARCRVNFDGLALAPERAGGAPPAGARPVPPLRPQFLLPGPADAPAPANR